jgi:plasmid stabilization system protein ParE
MKISFSEKFINSLADQVEFIAKDKPKAARKFKNDLQKNLLKEITFSKVIPLYTK